MADASAKKLHQVGPGRAVELLPDYLHDLKLVEEISLSYWQRLFDAAGYPTGLTQADLAPKKNGHERVAQALFTQAVPPELIDAIEATAEIGTARGREVLLQAADELGVSRTSWPNEVGAGELALDVWLRQSSDEALIEVLERARIRVFEMGATRPQQEFAGKAPKALPTNLEPHRARLKDDASAWFHANDRGSYAEVKCYSRDQGAVFQVIHGEPFRIELAITDDGSARSSVRYRPGLADLIRYDAVEGRLRIAARSAKLVAAYRRMFGQVLFGDPQFFMGDVRCTLRPLQEKGAELLQNLPLNMASVR